MHAVFCILLRTANFLLRSIRSSSIIIGDIQKFSSKRIGNKIFLIISLIFNALGPSLYKLHEGKFWLTVFLKIYTLKIESVLKNNLTLYKKICNKN